MPSLPPEIGKALRATRRRIVRARAVRGLAWTGSVSLCLFVVSLLLDRLLILSEEARLTLTGVTVLVTCSLLCWTLLRTLLRPGDLRLAWELEAREPRLAESLASAVQISRLPVDERERFSPVLLARLFRFAGARMPAPGRHAPGRGWVAP